MVKEEGGGSGHGRMRVDETEDDDETCEVQEEDIGMQL